MKSVYSSTNAYEDVVTPERLQHSELKKRGSSIKLVPIGYGHQQPSLGKVRVKSALGQRSSKSIRSLPHQMSSPDLRAKKGTRPYGKEWQANSVEKNYKGYNVPLKLSVLDS
jgi:hypothetical protein